MRAAILIALLAVGLAGCQQAPTKVYETKPTRETGTDKALSEQVILIDARPPFVSALAKPNGSLPLQWEDFTQTKAPFEGELEDDLFPQARRLARMGIGPDSDVLVLGRGSKGDGEEGRVAWTLLRMGLIHVRYESIDAIKWPLTWSQAPERPQVPIWKPRANATLEISRAEAIRKIKSGAVDFFVLDARPASEFTKDPEPFTKLHLKPRFEHLAWTEFLEERGTDAPKLTYKLQALGLKKTDQIAVIDERGVGAATAVLRLRELGYPDVLLWAGGYRELRALKTRGASR